jgi:hypothetical protein
MADTCKAASESCCFLAASECQSSLGFCGLIPFCELGTWVHIENSLLRTLIWQLRSVDGEEEGSRAEQGVVDRVMQWEQNAARQYADDGVADGWESDDSQPETAEQRYIRVSLMSDLDKGSFGRCGGMPAELAAHVRLRWNH